MPSYGYSLMCELYDPNELLAQAAHAEAAGFDFVTISDHFHPWLFSHHHSPYAWSVLGALGAQVLRLVRVSIGLLELGDLKKGAVRSLTKREKKLMDQALDGERG